MDNYPPDLTIDIPDSFYHLYDFPGLQAHNNTMDHMFAGIDPQIHREPQEQPIITTDIFQPTFPTPSELLSELATNGLPATTDEFGSDGRSESARKARRRAMAKSVGFIPTDPDTITSHEKKRHYLECLEQYVMYLHQQLELVGSQPIPLERVSNYRGLSSRSIRTLLVHMENTTRCLNLRTLDEEQRFVALRDLIYKRTSNGTGSG